MLFKKSMRTLIIVIIALTLTGFSYAFAASNTVGASKAGDGAGNITGYAVTNIHYTLNATTPTSIDSVSFTLDAPAGSVAVKLSSWHTCTVDSAGTAVTCSTTGETVLPATSLQVVASN